MKKFMCGLMLIGILFSGCSQQDGRFKDYPTINPSADFELTDQNEKPFHLKDLRGQVVFIFLDICPAQIFVRPPCPS